MMAEGGRGAGPEIREEGQDRDVIEAEPVRIVDGARPKSAPTPVMTEANKLTRRRNRERVSETFYGDSNPDPYHETIEVDEQEEVKRMHTHQSRKLPPWIWFVLAKSLGIKVAEDDRPWFGTLMHALTLLTAISFAASFAWYTVYDILNIYTKQTVLTGLTAIIIVIYYCTLGVYANKLAGKLFMSRRFVASVRLHTRTILKVSAAGIMVLLTISITVIDNYASSHTFRDDHCSNVSVPVIVCKIMYVSRVGYSVFNGLWNTLVSIVVLSVCRTHTIGIRRFIKQLELDARIIDTFYRKQMAGGRLDDSLQDFEELTEEEYLWDDDDLTGFPATTGEFDLSVERSGGGLAAAGFQRSTSYTSTTPRRTNTPRSQPQSAQPQSQPTSASNTAQNSVQRFQFPPPGGVAELSPIPGRPSIIVKSASIAEQGDEDDDLISLDSNNDVAPSNRQQQQRVDSPLLEVDGQQQQPQQQEQQQQEQQLPSTMTDTVPNSEQVSSEFSMEASSLTTEDILMRYWKIQTRMRHSSVALQRWLAAWVGFILIWSATFLVYWVSHEATLLGIAEFLLPLLILPLITAAYGEVNMEGKRMLKCICPTNDRVQMMKFLAVQPLEMTAFNFLVSYSAIITALGAFAIAFVTKIILDEINIESGFQP